MNPYNLILNRQEELIAISYALNMPEIITRAKEILNKNLYVILACDKNNEITKILKKSTGEIFETGQKFWSLKWGEWIENLIFDEALTGAVYFGRDYTNYVRSGYGGGLYHLNEISTTKPIKNAVQTNTRTIKLDGKEYFLIEKL